ncbi:MAG: ABC transporter permease, partial [Chloroflexales bacterium]|nr:ABC transporter permease [Chloroflexales bacterium]
MLNATTPQAQPGLRAPAEAKPRSLWGDAWRRLRSNRAALLGLATIIALVLVAIFADVLAPYPYDEQHIEA